MSTARVLIVDDNLATLELTKFVLDAAGFVIESTSDAMNAMFLIAPFKPDLILMDIQMPGIDGLELTGRIEGRCVDAAHCRGGIHRLRNDGRRSQDARRRVRRLHRQADRRGVVRCDRAVLASAARRRQDKSCGRLTTK